MFTSLMIAILGGIKPGLQSVSANEQEAAIKQQRKQVMLQYQQKSLSNLDTLQKVLDSQIAQATTRGISLDSPSLEAIQRNTLNVGARRQRNLDLEKSLVDQNLSIETANVRRTLYTQLFGDIEQGLSMGYESYVNLPKQRGL